MVCWVCYGGIGECVCDGNANDNPPKNQPPITIPDEEVLTRPSAVRRLAMAYRAKNLPRRRILDFIADHLYNYDGELIYQGRNVCFDAEIDDVFGTDRDPSERWLSDFLAFSVKPPRQRAQRRTFDRLVLLWTALAVHNRTQAELVIR